MLFFLDNDIISKKDDSSILAIQNFAECIESGRHIIIGSRGLLKSLYELDKLSPVSRRIFKMLYHKVTQFGIFKERITTYIHISGTIKEVIKLETDKNVIYKMPLSIFSNSKNLQETKLLCEDLLDCDFYQDLTEYYINKNNLGGTIGFEKINGGGLNTGKVYEQIVSTNFSPCLVIADSDKKNPLTNIGQTAQNIFDVYVQYNTQRITYSYILKVREKENLIPPEIYHCMESDDSIKHQFELLIKLYKNRDYRDTYFFGDIKSGFNINNDRELLKDFILSEINCLLEEDFTIEELLDSTKPLRKLLGNNNILCSVLDELYAESQENNVIYGVRKCFSKFKTDILEGGLKKIITEKRKLAHQHNTTTLHNQVAALEKRLDSINVTLQSTIKDEFDEYWNEIASLCFDWGCKIKIRVS